VSGYAASARLQGGSPRFGSAAGSGPREAPRGIAVATPALVDVADRDWIEIGARPFGERLAARWDDLCETWSQMTFFLFDPESWR